MTCYGWTIDYINECVTIPQIFLFMKQITGKPPISIISFGLGEEVVDDKKLLEQIGKSGIKVKIDKFAKKSIKSVIRLRDGKRIK